jgi:signal peptidase
VFDRKHLLGTVRGFLPMVGMATIIMNDYPAVKYGLIGVLALTVIFGKED